MRQGNDVGTQYRSAIYGTPTRPERPPSSPATHTRRATAAGHGEITTEILEAGRFYYAEDYHQQYLDKNPDGYCPVHATGVTLPAEASFTARRAARPPRPER